MKNIIIAMLIIVLLCVSCGPPITSVYDNKNQNINISQNRHIDKEAGVVCWTWGAAISCLPLNQTDLK